jgi:hypothetical protein
MTASRYQDINRSNFSSRAVLLPGRMEIGLPVERRAMFPRLFLLPGRAFCGVSAKRALLRPIWRAKWAFWPS